jgi:ADP-ribose pyrophosphatase YjhB (NUDIX family)
MRQRIGAYAVVLRTVAGRTQILLTRVSARGFPVGSWGLPGGGVAHGESPIDALRRELGEETSLSPITAVLVDVHDVHSVSPGRDDEYEDYHGIHLIYRVEVDAGVEPRVVEADGTTDLVAWVDADQAGGLGPLLPLVEHVLARLELFR